MTGDHQDRPSPSPNLWATPFPRRGGRIPVHVEDAVIKLVLQTINLIYRGFHNFLSAAVETFVLRIMQKVLNSPEFISRFFDAIIDNPGFIAPVVTLVKSEQQKLVIKLAKNEDRCPKFVEAGTKMDPHPVPVLSKESYRPPTDISTTRRTDELTFSTLAMGLREWMARCKTIPCRKFEYSLEVPGVTVIKPMNEVFTDAVDYQNYRLIKKSTRYNDNVAT